MGAISYRALVVSSESERWVQHTHEVLANLQNLLLALTRIESSYRGFVLTGEESRLESYRADILSSERYLATIRNLTSDNPAQQREIPALERLTAQEIQFAEMVIDRRRSTGLFALGGRRQSASRGLWRNRVERSA